MKVVYNKFIPFKGFAAINLFGVIFARRGERISKRTIRHESIHTAQMRDLLYIGFYLWYLIEWIVRLFMRGGAYRNISFEREAYTHENDVDYLKERHGFAFFNYLIWEK